MIKSAQVTTLYRHSLRAGLGFVDVNFRHYSWRVLRDRYRQNRNETDPQRIAQLYELGVKNLGVIQRQSVINRMYASHESVLAPRYQFPILKQQN